MDSFHGFEGRREEGFGCGDSRIGLLGSGAALRSDCDVYDIDLGRAVLSSDGVNDRFGEITGL